MSTSDSADLRQRVILVGVGGATCSGKTTLAKHLLRCIPNSIIIHQDDFAPPQELVPIHPEYGVQDWDDAPGAIEWPRMRTFMKEIKETGIIPGSHMSHDHLNEQKIVSLSNETFDRWRDMFAKLTSQYEEKKGEKIIWGLVDGFLLYWDEEVIRSLDVRIFLRASYDVLKKRRHERHGYHTAAQFDPEGTLWRDPPNYFDQIVYPAYVRAHKRIFVDGNLDHGVPNGFIQDLILIDGEEVNMDDLFERSAKAIWDFFNSNSDVQMDG